MRSTFDVGSSKACRSSCPLDRKHPNEDPSSKSTLFTHSTPFNPLSSSTSSNAFLSHVRLVPFVQLIQLIHRVLIHPTHPGKVDEADGRGLVPGGRSALEGQGLGERRNVARVTLTLTLTRRRGLRRAPGRAGHTRGPPRGPLAGRRGRPSAAGGGGGGGLPGASTPAVGAASLEGVERTGTPYGTAKVPCCGFDPPPAPPSRVFSHPTPTRLVRQVIHCGNQLHYFKEPGLANPLQRRSLGKKKRPSTCNAKATGKMVEK